MHFGRTVCGSLALAGAVALLGAAPANAVPKRFWGVVPQAGLSPAQLVRLRNGGVDSVRLPISWAAVQPSPGRPPDFSSLDAAVGNLARANLELLPFLYDAPRWAVRPHAVPGSPGSARAPLHLPAAGAAGRAWAAFVRAAVERYGPSGSFWSENPALPRRPVHAWQVWNEENFKYFVVRPNPAEYGRLVKRSGRAIHAVDPH